MRDRELASRTVTWGGPTSTNRREITRIYKKTNSGQQMCQMAHLEQLQKPSSKTGRSSSNSRKQLHSGLAWKESTGTPRAEVQDFINSQRPWQSGIVIVLPDDTRHKEAGDRSKPCEVEIVHPLRDIWRTETRDEIIACRSLEAQCGAQRLSTFVIALRMIT